LVTTKRVLFVAEAVTLAHVGRASALAAMVDRSRYTPLLAWHPRYNQLLGQLSDEFYPLESISSEQFVDRLRTARPVYDFHTMEEYATWELEVFREARPDVVVGDFRLSLATSARIAGLPYINVINAHWSPFARPRFIVPESPPVGLLGPRIGQLIFDIARPFFFLAYANDFNRLAEKFGRPSFGYDLREIYCEGDRTLYPDIPEVTPTRDLPPTHRYLGPVAWSPALPLPSFCDSLDRDRPLVYVTLGTSGNVDLVPCILDVLSKLDAQVVCATGGRIDLESRSEDHHLVDFVSGDAMCGRADLLVFNGGVGGTQQALAAGIPSVGIPSNLDQYLNMYFVERAGIGKLVRSDRATERQLTATIRQLLEDQTYRRRAEELGQRARAYQPGTILNEVLDNLIAERRAPERPATFTATSPELPKIHPPVPVEEVREAVHAAVLAPSAGNCQPWRYRWNRDCLEIRVVPQRANPFLDFVNLDTWVSLGAVLTNLEVAAEAQGRRIASQLFPHDARGGLVGRVWLLPGAAPDGSLVAAVRERCTNRRPHDGRPIPADVRDEVVAAAAPHQPEVRVDWVEEPAARDRIATATSAYFQLLFENPGLLVSMLGWIRWSHAAEARAQSGLSLASLELGAVSRLMFRLAASRWRSRLLAPTGMFSLYRRMTARGLQRTAAFGLVTVSEPDAASFVRAGEAFERMWLTATQRRLAVHPLAGLMLLAGRCRYAGGVGLTPRQRRTVEDAVAMVGQVAPAILDRVPVMLFRIGYAPPPTARSLRLPLDSVFEAVADQATDEPTPATKEDAAGLRQLAGRSSLRSAGTDFRISPRNRYAAANRAIVESEIRPDVAVSFVNEVDMAGVKALRAAYSAESRPPYTAFVVKALARSLEEHPYANRRIYTTPMRLLLGTRYQQFDTVDVGVAVERDLPGDAPLAFVDIIRDCNRRSIEEITAFLMNLRSADRDNNDQWRKFSGAIEGMPTWLASFFIGLPIRSGKLWRRWRGGPALVSSPTKYGVDILSTSWTWPIGVSYGLVKDRPVVMDGELAIRPTSFVTMSFDRRVMSGAQAARFFARLSELLADPSWMTERPHWQSYPTAIKKSPERQPASARPRTGVTQ
jgi:UDP:flavonoid glycosyltransferase YjiC (YdhE family)/pyruvate/2-oxoglutarate dehydrogenase complex dihydrolipoamide acyltransferase (E2) component